MLVSAVVPLIAYRLARPETGSDALALVIAGAIPVTWTLIRLLWRQRLDPIGVFCVAAFGLGLVILVLAGGNALAFKIREPVLAGSFGLLCLASLAARRPLALIALRRGGHKASDQALRRAASGITAIAGVTLTVYAAVLIGLAVTVSSSTYLALYQPIGLPILGAGLAALPWRKRRNRSAAPAGRGDPAGRP